jgi:thioredoxin 1
MSASMNTVVKVAIVLILAATVAAVVIRKQAGDTRATAPPPATAGVAGLPRLVDLGSTTCVPCRMMAPILEDLRRQLAGRLEVEFIDVVANPAAGNRYGIRVIPTQVFLDAYGKELWRHEGFISKEDILAKWKELDVSLASPAGEATTASPATVPSVTNGST